MKEKQTEIRITHKSIEEKIAFEISLSELSGGKPVTKYIKGLIKELSKDKNKREFERLKSIVEREF